MVQKSAVMHRLTSLWRPGWLVIVALVICAASLLLYTSQYAVNMMFWDQWGVYGVFFAHGSWLDALRWQVGQHRQGLGALLIYVTSSFTAWDGRADAFLVAVTLIVATILALLLIKRYTGRFSLLDVVIPVLFLSLNQWEVVTIVPNVSAAALPLALVILYALGLTIARARVQVIVLSILNALLLYTGYGLIADFITPLLFAWRSLRPEQRGNAPGIRWWWLAGLALALIIAATFFANYVFTTGADCPVFPHPYPFDYLVFVGLMVAQGFGLAPLADQLGMANGAAMLIGLLIIIAAILIACKSIRTARGMAVVFLIGYALLFVSMAAVGRVCLGATRQALSSRYITLVLPLILGIYMWARAQNMRRQITTGAGISALLLLALLPPFYRSPYTLTPQVFHDYKTTWAACYVATLDPYHCNTVAGSPVYPETQAIIGSLRFLEQNRLNLFRDMAQDVVIVSPARLESASVPIMGIVNPPGFERYEVQWGTGEYPKEWQWLSGPHRSPIPYGKITEWNTSSLPSGLYTVRVTVFLQGGGQRIVMARFTKP